MGTSNGGGTREVEDRELAVKLTPEEMIKRGNEMSACELEAERLKLDRKALNADIEIQVKRRAVLAHAIERGAEDRMVRCEWQEDFQKNVFRLVRKDTGVVVDTRPMTAKDRTGKLGFDDDRDDVGADAPPPRKPRKKAAGAGKKDKATTLHSVTA